VASFPYTATLPGTYVFTVTDSRGCPATSTITVTQTTPTHTTVKPILHVTDSIMEHYGNCFAWFYHNVYLCHKVQLPFTTQARDLFTGLAAGIYDIKVIDSKGVSLHQRK
jgi:hypothetical protein